MTQALQEAEQPEKKRPPKAFFIFYLEGEEYVEELRRLAIWVERLLLPVYGGEVTSSSPWCPRWREHPEAIGQLHALWLAWQVKTGPEAEALGPLEWHRDCLGHVMETLRNPSGPFAGCKPGAHRAKERPTIENDGFLGNMPRRP
ncbi:DUF4913 domain-containing protein [Pseudosporangium ferrugineum]|uniref:Uncharacterized protein DUF4913 n=1 Tax=Pseudosporangium ferrugineum TaxID=439699 RepID=A0A2T0S3E2_9ACTN|nr:DUF4913 domain-containing protein [Pseudosporangium ferrugineum]PRY27930.1 uncharacterized protein DUF4913 [Pseudosporangium ferrugineum]